MSGRRTFSLVGATRRVDGFATVRVFGARLALAAEEDLSDRLLARLAEEDLSDRLLARFAEEDRSERLLARFADSRRSRASRVARVSAVLRL